MAQASIAVRGLGKEYRLGAIGARSFRDEVESLWRKLRCATDRRGNASPEGSAQPPAPTKIWALRDVTFDVQQGEVMGVIGRNGAGKSTLLKILSRITEPTEGEATIRGRIASLLEVGTGFHPELSGRENIYLNGTILGMTRKEADRKLDEIVAFADIAEFLDTPVKRYSSGMYVRLAFAVAAHLEPEILIVDEVLAVGDLQFQRKCIGKMRAVSAAEGRTVLVVSHSLGVIRSLCDRCVLLEHGRLSRVGPVEEVLEAYAAGLESEETGDLTHREDRLGKGSVRVTGLHLHRPMETAGPPAFHSGEALVIDIATTPFPGELTCIVVVKDHLGTALTTFNSALQSATDQVLPAPHNTFRCEVPSLPFLPGTYRLDVGLVRQNQFEDLVENAGAFTVLDGTIDGRPATADRHGRNGPLVLPHRWVCPTAPSTHYAHF